MLRGDYGQGMIYNLKIMVCLDLWQSKMFLLLRFGKNVHSLGGVNANPSVDEVLTAIKEVQS